MIRNRFLSKDSEELKEGDPEETGFPSASTLIFLATQQLLNQSPQYRTSSTTKFTIKITKQGQEVKSISRKPYKVLRCMDFTYWATIVVIIGMENEEGCHVEGEG